MFDSLRMEIQELQVPVDTVALTELLALRDRLDAKINETIAGVDEAGLWELDGAVSMSRWLVDKAVMPSGAAARTVRTATLLRSLPETKRAWETGSLSSGQVETIVANVGSKRAELFARGEAGLIPALEGRSIADTRLIMNNWREAADDALNTEPKAERDNELFLSELLDGRHAMKGNFDSEAAGIIRTALRLATTKDDTDQPRTPAVRRSHALVDIFRYFLDHHNLAPTGRNRPHVSAILDLEEYEARGGTATMLDGGILSREATGAMLCDCVIHRVVMKGRSTILDYGTATQTISQSLWESLIARDHHCRFPGCDRPRWWCDGHHLVWYSNNGETNPDNLVTMCRRHHTLLHKKGWHAKLLPDGTFEVTDPNGQVRTTAPPGTLASAAA